MAQREVQNGSKTGKAKSREGNAMSKRHLTTTGRGYEWEGTNVRRASHYADNWFEETKAMVDRGFHEFCQRRGLIEYYEGHSYVFSDKARR